MKRNRIIMMLVIIISVMALGLIVYLERKSEASKERPTFDVSSEELDTMLGVRFVLFKDENRGIDNDVYSSIFREDELHHYLIVPEDAAAFSMVCYALDEYGNLLNRYVIDFSESDEYMVGLRTIHLVRTKLPIIAIDISEDSPSFEELLASDKDVECFGDLTLSVDKELAHKNSWIEEIHSKDSSKSTLGSMILKGRGNASWYFSPKKSFSIVFEKATYMLDLGKHKKWNLISNAQDKSLLNNEIFLDLSRNCGVQYESGCEQVTLFVNGIYQGVYLLTSKVSVDKDRVDLEKDDYFFCFGATNAEQPLFYESNTWIDDGGAYSEPFANLEWPKAASEQQLTEAREIVQRFIGSMEDTDDTTYSEYVDIDSMARYYWAQEISMNYDAIFRSTYSYYKADDGKMYMGPVWDLDLSNGWNADKAGSVYTEPEGWKLRNQSWYAPLFEREDFRNLIADVYINGGVREAMFKALKDYEERMSEMAVDGELNYQRWYSDVPNLGIKYGDSYEEQTKGCLDFFRRRVEWIDLQMYNKR